MLFSSTVFLFLFLPLSLLAYYIVPKQLKNAVLLLCSLLFYAWGGVSLSLILVFSLLINYFSGRWIAASVAKKKLALSIGVSLNLALLVVFKYANFIVENVNHLQDVFHFNEIPDPGIVLPIGISFFTFQAISYLVDIYREEAKVQRNFINLALYISLFPQLIAGPIVRYHDISKQLINRDLTIAKFRSGVERFVLGLAKKVLLANNFAYVADQVFEMPLAEFDSSVAWLGIISYALQIYFDFAGYSDMAIGLGRMFGFEFLENFNFPYISRSIKEFWRRWHISLSTWFRDYLYIPLGGNRKGAGRTYVNLLIVFFMTGFWHGASWSFLVWGLFHGAFLVLERLGLGTVLKRIGRVPAHIYTLLVVLIGWVFFRVEQLDEAFDFVLKMFAFKGADIQLTTWTYFMNPVLFLLYPFAFLSSSYFFPRVFDFFRKKYAENAFVHALWPVLKTIFLFAIFMFSVMFILADAYNPFIYFRF